MHNIQPQTYKEIIRLKNCLELQKYVPEVDDDFLQKIYDFLGAPDHNIQIAEEFLHFYESGNIVESVKITPRPYDYTSLTCSGVGLHITRPYVSNDSYGDSGGSSNNNNNNNNNNNA